MKKKVYLTGYEQQTIEEFIRKIEEAGIERIVDVRELPLSRKKGFSKNSLKIQLAKHGISYVHIRELGTPKALRRDLKEKGDYLKFFKQYRIHIRGKHIELQKLINMASTEILGIMCFEKDCELCHRTIIGDKILKMDPSLEVITL